MQQTQGAIGNLLNRYRAILKKCHFLNTMASVAVAGSLILVAAPAAAIDNVTAGSDGIVRVSGGEWSTVGLDRAQGLSVTGGKLYIGNKIDVSGKNAVGSANTYVANGRVYVGHSADKTPAPGASLTTDNMTIAQGGVVDVSYDSSIIIKDNGSVDILAGGTLKSEHGKSNLVNGNVNLHGGTIEVAKGAAMTIGSKPSSGLLQSATDRFGVLYVSKEGNKTFTSTGGTINAHLYSEGKTRFTGGTTTVDNMTVAGGTTLITGNARVEVASNVVDVKGGQLLMRGGTLSIMQGEGLLDVNAKGKLVADQGFNTIEGSVQVRDQGKVQVTKNGVLTITGNLHAAAKDSVTVGGAEAGNASLTVNGKVTADVAGAIVVGGTGKGAAGSFTLSQAAAQGITTADGVKVTKNTGSVILTDSGRTEITLAELQDLANKLAGFDGLTTGTGGYEGTNFILAGVKVTDASKDISGNKSATAPEQLHVQGGKISADVVITAPSLSSSTGSLAVAGQAQLNGSLGAERTSSFNTLSIDATGTVNMSQAAVVTTKNLDMSKGGTVSVNTGSHLASASTVMGANSKIDVMHSTASLGKLDMSKGGSIFVDPAYVNASSIDKPVAGDITLGLGGKFTVGALNEAYIDSMFQNIAKQQAKVAGGAVLNTANAAVFATGQTLALNGNGSLTIDPSFGADVPATTTKAAPPVNGVTVAKDGVLAIDVAGLDAAKDGTKIAIDLSGATNKNVSLADGSVLYFDGLTYADNGKLNVFAGGTITQNGADLYTPDRMLNLTEAGLNGQGVLEGVAINKVTNVLPNVDGTWNGVFTEIWENSKNGVNADNAGVRFLSRLVHDQYFAENQAHAASKTLEGAAQLASVVGVQSTTMQVSRSGANAIAARTSFASPLNDQSKSGAVSVNAEGKAENVALNGAMRNGFGMWITPLYQNMNANKVDGGAYDGGFSANYGGVALGADYTFHDHFRFGLAFNIGGGFAETSGGDYNSADNSFNFWGLSLYGNWSQNNFGLTADVGYTSLFNDVSMDMPTALAMGDFKSDINSSAWTAGLRGEYKFDLDQVDIIPHVGVRYTALITDGYDITSGGSTVFDVKRSVQNLWSIPVGVTFAGDFTTDGGWNIKPQADLSVVTTMGDLKAKSKVHVPGFGSQANLDMKVLDDVMFDGAAGIEVGKENLAFGLNYNIQASEHFTNHGLFGTVSYKF